MHIIILETLLAIFELPHLPLLLLLKSHVPSKSCARAAAAVALVRHYVPDYAIRCCGLLHLMPVFFLRIWFVNYLVQRATAVQL